MGEDRGIPDHVNDGVPVDEVDRRARYEVALFILAHRDDDGNGDSNGVRDGDALRMAEGDGAISRMKRDAFINAAINNVPAVIKKLRASYPSIVDLQGLVDRVRLEVIMRRLD